MEMLDTVVLDEVQEPADDTHAPDIPERMTTKVDLRPASHPACAASSSALRTAAPGSRGAPSIWSGAEASLLDLLDTPAHAGHRRGPSAGAVLAPDVLEAAAAPHAAASLDEDFLRSLVGAGSGAPTPPAPPPDARSPPCPALILP